MCDFTHLFLKFEILEADHDLGQKIEKGKVVQDQEIDEEAGEVVQNQRIKQGKVNPDQNPETVKNLVQDQEKGGEEAEADHVTEGEAEGAEVNLQDVPQDALLDVLPSESDLQTENLYDAVQMVLQLFLYGETEIEMKKIKSLKRNVMLEQSSSCNLLET